MEILLVTSDDYWLTPFVLDALDRLGHRSRMIDVRLQGHADLRKKLKLLALFGAGAAMGIIRASASNKRRLADRVVHTDAAGAVEAIRKTECLPLLMNYPQKFPVLEKPVLNFHPSVLPSYRGLMSLPRATLDRLSGRHPMMGATIHEIAATFDAGPIRWRVVLPEKPLTLDLRRLYERVYASAAAGLNEIAGRERAIIPPAGTQPSYSRALGWDEVFALKWLLLTASFRPSSCPCTISLRRKDRVDIGANRGKARDQRQRGFSPVWDSARPGYRPVASWPRTMPRSCHREISPAFHSREANR